jgi:hypothetical protein
VLRQRVQIGGYKGRIHRVNSAEAACTCCSAQKPPTPSLPTLHLQLKVLHHSACRSVHSLAASRSSKATTRYAVQLSTASVECSAKCPCLDTLASLFFSAERISRRLWLPQYIPILPASVPRVVSPIDRHRVVLRFDQKNAMSPQEWTL